MPLRGMSPLEKGRFTLSEAALEAEQVVSVTSTASGTLAGEYQEALRQWGSYFMWQVDLRSSNSCPR